MRIALAILGTIAVCLIAAKFTMTTGEASVYLNLIGM